MHNQRPMKVAFTPKAMTTMGALPEADARDARDLIRRLRAASTPVGKRVAKQPAQYEASLGRKGVLMQYEVMADVATVVGVVSSVRRALAQSDDDTAREPASRA